MNLLARTGLVLIGLIILIVLADFGLPLWGGVSIALIIQFILVYFIIKDGPC